MNLSAPPPPPLPAENALHSDAAVDGDARVGSPDWLPPGHRLDEFEIVRVLGAGGFGIVYLALDQVLLRYVAIKEYFPVALAGRNKNGQVEERSRESGTTFELGLESFINEARLLASFDHPSLVKVHRFWKQNGTAYMVMQYYPGQTLKEARRAMQTPPDEAWLRAFMEPLLGALEVLHAQAVFHRDIAPDNILLLPDGQPVVLDFGSARRVIGDSTQSLTAVLKPNFSPVEQYADDAGMRQGAYTDLFALGGTVRFMLTGDAPTPAVMRAVRDTLPALSRCGADRFPGVSMPFLATLDWTLALAPSDRPQNVAMVRDALRGAIVPPEPTARHLSGDDAAKAFGATAALAKTQVYPAAQQAPEARTVPLRNDIASAPNGGGRVAATATWHRHAKATASVSVALASVALAWTLFLGDGPQAKASDGGAVAVGQKALPTATVPVATIASASPSTSASSASTTDAAIEPVTVVATTAPVRSEAAASHAAAKSKRTADATPRRAAAEPSVVATAATATPAPVHAKTGGERGPLDACAALGVFAKALCIKRACDEPALKSMPQCIESRRLDEQRQRRMDQ